MALVDDAPDSQAWLARRIPSEVLEHLGKRELKARLDAAEDKLREVPLADNDYERNALKRESDKILNAISLRAFIASAQLLMSQIEAAKENGGGKAQRDLLQAFDRLHKNNPQPGMTMPGVLEEISTFNVAAAKSPRWKFWRKNA